MWNCLKLEKWWLDWAYLEWRESLVPYLNTSAIGIDSEQIVEKYARLKESKLNVQAARSAVSIYFYVKLFQELRK